MATAFLVHTQLSWGKTCDYLIANDVEPGLMHRYETREDWQEVILDALINVPLAHSANWNGKNNRGRSS